ncbi:hypothetical protein Sjap_010933 [Stephania japonica]|uniref:Uncharacterized protein n=1 Tax=Stephania japonica TaxID=461633 RepID=A0AAP0JAC0_9MAGN
MQHEKNEGEYKGKLDKELGVTQSNAVGEGGDSPVVVVAAAKKEGRHQGYPERGRKPPSRAPGCHAPGLKLGAERSLDSSRDQTGPYGPVNGPGQLTLDQLTRVN